ncbi:lectin, galactoside-binding, soluble, 2b [Pholidichthys leucotaenia]
MIIHDLAFREGLELKLRLKPDEDAERFAVNIGHDADNIALHFNPRFDSGGTTDTIVFNSKSGGCWDEEMRESKFPFTRGEECKLYINFNNEQFYIKLPDGCMVNFPNRLGEFKYDYLGINGGVKLMGLKLK